MVFKAKYSKVNFNKSMPKFVNCSETKKRFYVFHYSLTHSKNKTKISGCLLTMFAKELGQTDLGF